MDAGTECKRAGHTGYCLIAEDEALIAMHIQEEVADFGFSVAGPFLRGAEALSWLEDNRPALAVLDCQLLDGVCIELARRCEELRVPYVLYSGRDLNEAEMKSFNATRLIRKPAPGGELRRALVDIALKL